MTDAMTKHPLYLIMNYQRLSRLLPTCTTGQSSRQLRYVGVGVPFVLLAVVPISAMAVTDETQSISQSQQILNKKQWGLISYSSTINNKNSHY